MDELPSRILSTSFNEEQSLDPCAVGNRSTSGASPICFRNIVVLPNDRLVLRDGKPVELGGRAFDLLVVLLRSRGYVVSKKEIVDHVWPSTLVDESNLRFQMACLRRALGDDRDAIKTIQGRGYLFAADIISSQSAPGSLAEPNPWISEPLPFANKQIIDGNRWPEASSFSNQPVIAVIDDDPDTREALDGLLRSAGLLVQTYPNVQAFVDSDDLASVECLVLDVWLPGRSGLDFQADLAKSAMNIPVILISGHADVPMSVRAMKAGAVEFLTKPVRHEDLLGAIHTAVAAGRSDQSSGFKGRI